MGAVHDKGEVLFEVNRVIRSGFPGWWSGGGRCSDGGGGRKMLKALVTAKQKALVYQLFKCCKQCNDYIILERLKLNPCIYLFRSFPFFPER